MGVMCNMQAWNIEDPGVSSETNGDQMKDVKNY